MEKRKKNRTGNVDMRPEEDFLIGYPLRLAELNDGHLKRLTEYLDEQLDHCYAQQLGASTSKAKSKKNI